MHLSRLDLEEFRLYHRASLALAPAGLSVLGDNASGKSTIVEAITLLATMRSPRTSADRELINARSGADLGVQPYARAVGTVERAEGTTSIEVGFQLADDAAGPLRKLVEVNGRTTRVVDAVGTLKVVLFSPEDVALASGPPSLRRRYLDLMLSQLDNAYIRALARYARILEQRNSLLRQLSKQVKSEPNLDVGSQLGYWDDELVAHGARIVATRLVAVGRLAELAADRFALFGSGKELTVTYVPSVAGELVGANASQDATQAKVAVLMTARLKEGRRDELRRGVTLVGPHRDDVSFALDGLEVGAFGSRGQQRLTLVALKLAEADLMTERAGEPPVILLDDVLSELDRTNRELLLQALADGGEQIVVTAADPELLAGPELAHLPVARVKAGTVTIA